MSDDRLAHLAFIDSIEMMLHGCQESWIFKILRCAQILKLLRIELSCLSLKSITMLNFDILSLEKACKEFFDRVWLHLSPNPRVATSEQILFSTYKYLTACFRGAKKHTRHLSIYVPRQLRATLLRFKLGGHGLQIAKAELEGKKERSNSVNAVASFYQTFYVGMQAYTEIRRKYSHQFQQSSLSAFFNMKQVHIAGFILLEMQAKRKQFWVIRGSTS